jgi:heme oxygenase (mycobilin-producing)
MSQPVVLINPFEVPDDHAERFMHTWEAARDYLRAQPGYRTTSLHHSLTPDATYTFVNIAEWDSPAHFQQAIASDRFASLARPTGPTRPCTGPVQH